MKTIKVINKQVAKDLSIDEKEVTQINDYFWKSFKSRLINLDTPTFYVKEIGTFTVSKYKVYKEIKFLIRKLRNIPNLTYREVTVNAMENETYETLRKYLKFRNYLAKQEYNELLSRIKNDGSKNNS